jgi:hypothetical protein
MGIKRRIGHKIKQGAKAVYHAATDPTVVIIKEQPQPQPQFVYVERRPTTYATNGTLFHVERHSDVNTLSVRVGQKLSDIEYLSHYHSYSSDYDFDDWDALKRFGRALTNLYYDGYCHRISVSVISDELAVIRRMILNCGVPVIKDNHSAYRVLAQVFLSKYFD